MTKKKEIFVIIGSAAANSANEKLVVNFISMTRDYFNVKVFKDLKTLPHFDPKLTIENTPKKVIAFRNEIKKADGILICSPEYIFSIPSGLKNSIEWCVSTNVFSNKPTGLITASASGQKSHEELQLIMKTVMAKFTNETTLLIQGVKEKFDEQGNLSDLEIKKQLDKFITDFNNLVNDK